MNLETNPLVGEEALRAGANDFLVKGRTDAALLERALRYAVSHHRTLDELRFFRAAVELATESVVVTAADLDRPGPQIVYVNPAFTAMTGYELEDVLGRTPRLLQGPETDRLAMARLRRRLARGEIFSCETVNYRKDGSPFWVAFRVGPIRDAAENVTHYVAVQEDVTVRRTLEHERGRLEDELRQAQKLEPIGRLAGGVAHDFNNILTGILGYNQLIMKGLAETDPRYEYTLEIERAGRRAAALTHQLLAFARKEMLQSVPADLNEIVEGMLGLLRPLIGDAIELETNLEPDLGLVEVDPSQIEQVILNLAVNARDAMPHGGPLTIETARSSGEPPDGLDAGSYVILAVHDSGIGMDKETEERAFEPFFTTKPVGVGTGLGLSSIEGIIEQSGGRVRLRTEPARGTMVEIHLPELDGPVERKAPVPETNGDGRGLRLCSGSETVLVVEDDDGIRLLATLVLAEAGYTVLKASSGSEAIAISQAHGGAIQLLVSDIAMPGMAGDEVAARLTAERPEMSVLFISGYTGDELVEHGGQLPPDMRLLRKPFLPEELLAHAREILDESSPPGGHSSQSDC